MWNGAVAYAKSQIKILNVLASWTAAIAGVLALICAIVPPLQVLVPVLGMIALTAGVLQLSTDVVMMADGQKKLSFSTLGLDVLGVLPMGKLGALAGKMGKTATVFKAAAKARSIGRQLTVAARDTGEGIAAGKAAARNIMKAYPPVKMFVRDWLQPAELNRYGQTFRLGNPSTWANWGKTGSLFSGMDKVTKVETVIGGLQWGAVNYFNAPTGSPLHGPSLP